MKRLITVFKNLILGSWRVSAQDPLGFNEQQSLRVTSEASLAQPWTNSLLWSGYPGTKFFANDVSQGIDILIHPFYFLVCPWFAGSWVYVSAPVGWWECFSLLTLSVTSLRILTVQTEVQTYISPAPVLPARLNSPSVLSHGILSPLPLQLCSQLPDVDVAVVDLHPVESPLSSLQEKSLSHSFQDHRAAQVNPLQLV